jgi:hypothetical protein
VRAASEECQRFFLPPGLPELAPGVDRGNVARLELKRPPERLLRVIGLSSRERHQTELVVRFVEIRRAGNEGTQLLHRFRPFSHEHEG